MSQNLFYYLVKCKMRLFIFFLCVSSLISDYVASIEDGRKQSEFDRKISQERGTFAR